MEGTEADCSISVGKLADACVIEVAGEVDVATVSMVARALDNAVRSCSDDVIVDAQRLTYIDSAGIQTLLSTQHRLAAAGRRLAIVGCHGIFHKLLEISKLDRHFLVYPSVDEAVEGLASGQQAAGSGQ